LTATPQLIFILFSEQLNRYQPEHPGVGDGDMDAGGEKGGITGFLPRQPSSSSAASSTNNDNHRVTRDSMSSSSSSASTASSFVAVPPFVVDKVSFL
jgi:hypothetical protein